MGMLVIWIWFRSSTATTTAMRIFWQTPSCHETRNEMVNGASRQHTVFEHKKRDVAVDMALSRLKLFVLHPLYIGGQSRG
jgi:hypothetical protein